MNQVSVEAIFAVSMLMLFLTAVYLNLGQTQGRLDFASERVLQGNDCEKLATAIRLVVSENTGARGGAQFELAISSPATISGNSIRVGNYTCHFSGSGISANIATGNVMVKKEGGVVSVENF